MTNPSRFLLIDDDETNNILCSFTIRRAFNGAEIKAFTNPEKGLASIKEISLEENGFPITLFLDINMPHMTGWELLEEFENLEDRIKSKFAIYIMSSSLDVRDKQKADMHPLVSGYVSKPLTQELMDSIFADKVVGEERN